MYRLRSGTAGCGWFPVVGVPKRASESADRRSAAAEPTAAAAGGNGGCAGNRWRCCSGHDRRWWWLSAHLLIESTQTNIKPKSFDSRNTRFIGFHRFITRIFTPSLSVSLLHSLFCPSTERRVSVCGASHCNSGGGSSRFCSVAFSSLALCLSFPFNCDRFG